MNLSQLQQEIFEIVRGGGAVDSPQIVSTNPLTSQERLSVYRKGSHNKILSCFTGDFEVTKILMGDKTFDACAKMYFEKYPADTHFINECGRYFPEFLQSLSDFKQDGLLLELATAEWLRVESFYDFFHFQNQATTDEIKVNPSLKKITSKWPLHLIWREEKRFDAAPDGETYDIWVWTTDNRRVQLDAFEKLETKVFEELIHSKNLELSIEKLLTQIDPDKLQSILTENLATWINRGFIELKAG